MTEWFSLGTAPFREDPHTVYERARQHGGVCPVAAPAPYYAVFGAADVRAILRDYRNWQSRNGPGLAYARPHGVLVATDPPVHTTQRALVAPVFRPDAMAALESPLRLLVDELIGNLAPRGHADLITDLAVPVSLTVVCWQLGVPTDRIADLWSWVRQLAEALSYPSGALDRRVIGGYRSFFEYFSAHITRRIRDLDAGEQVPHDLLTHLMSTEHDGRRPARSELLAFCQFLLVAGSTTTTLLIGNLVHRLIEHPQQLGKLRDDRTLLPNAIEESLRLDAPLHGLFRTSPADHRVGNYDIPANTKVLLTFGAANRDPELWEAPECFDITRSAQALRRHLSFGHGIHYCLGAGQARLETAAVLNAILDRLSGLRHDGEPRRIRAEILNGFESLPVAWDAPGTESP